MGGVMRLLIFGAGYSGRALARAVKPRAAWIGGTRRRKEAAAQLAGEGMAPFVFDGVRGEGGLAEAVRQATHILVSVPPGDGDPVLAVFGEALADARDLRWIGYLSTVGVYGNYAGAWVSERTTPHPATERARQRLAAEKAWLERGAELGVPVSVFRLAGIYGPGRNALARLAAGTAHRIRKPGQVFNRIHVDDLAAVVAAALARDAGGLFNVADDEPAPPEGVVAHAAALMGVEAPPVVSFESADMSPMARSFYADNKRVSNRRLRDDLGVALRYPTYRDGLAALWRGRV